MHFSYHGKPMHERSDAEVVWVFLVVPPLFAVLITCVVAGMALRNPEALADNLFGLAYTALLVLGLAACPPAVGWRELKRRKATGSRFH